MPSKAGEPPGKNWKSCAGCWMSTRGEPDDNPGARNLSRTAASARLDAAALCLAGSCLGGALCRGKHDLPASDDTLCPRCDYARADDGGARDHVHRADAAK